MFDRISRLWSRNNAPKTRQGLHRPFRDPTTNFLYNLLFCDEPSLFSNDTTSVDEPWSTVLGAAPTREALEAIADDAGTESRIRALAFNRLRAQGFPVPTKILLGVIIEVPLREGLDVLAAYVDRRVRYINHVERGLFIEDLPGGFNDAHRDLMEASRRVVDQIGPWHEKRLPPPGAGQFRMTFLVSDGLYLGQGRFDAIAADPIGAPVQKAARALLALVVDFAIKQSQQPSGPV